MSDMKSPLLQGAAMFRVQNILSGKWKITLLDVKTIIETGRESEMRDATRLIPACKIREGIEIMCQEIQTFGFHGTYKLLSYPNLFYQTPKLWEYKPLKGLYFLYHFIPQKSTNEPSGFFHFGETFASFSHSNVANAFRSSSVVTSR